MLLVPRSTKALKSELFVEFLPSLLNLLPQLLCPPALTQEKWTTIPQRPRGRASCVCTGVGALNKEHTCILSRIICAGNEPEGRFPQGRLVKRTKADDRKLLGYARHVPWTPFQAHRKLPWQYLCHKFHRYSDFVHHWYQIITIFSYYQPIKCSFPDFSSCSYKVNSPFSKKKPLFLEWTVVITCRISSGRHMYPQIQVTRPAHRMPRGRSEPLSPTSPGLQSPTHFSLHLALFERVNLPSILESEMQKMPIIQRKSVKSRLHILRRRQTGKNC